MRPEREIAEALATAEFPTLSGRADVQFWSVDSAPKKLAGQVPLYTAPICLLLFALVSFALLWAVNELPAPNAFFPSNDLIFAPVSGTHSIALRIFILSFYTAFAMTCTPVWSRKFAFAADLIVTFAIVCLLIDGLCNIFYHQMHVIFSLHIVEIASGLAGFIVFAFKLLERGEMPSRVRLHIDTTQTRAIALRLLLVSLIAGGLAWYIGSLDLWVEIWARKFTLLGGIGPGVFLFLQLFFLLLYLGARVEAHLRPDDPFAPPLTVFVPAHNESYVITQTIRAMDKAAAHYGGEVKLLVMNNNSTDSTWAVANAALAACSDLKGEVIDVPKPGKANALNAGLDRVDTEFCVRVDADTQLRPDCFTRAMRHFNHADVGIVGGVPLPPGGGLFDRARQLEVAVKHGFYSVAYGTINSVVGIPGMFSVYRTHIPRALGGFVEGMNGEDTDISLRGGEMGYRLIVDPKVRYVSEVPATYRHMREQRMRWFRSSYHVSARCRDLIYSNQASIRGKVMLPYMLVNTGRRAMMVPLIIFGLIEYLTNFDSFNTLAWQSVIAVGVGAPSLMAILCALLLRMPKAIICLPEYLLFRLLRAYFTLESMLSISISNRSEPLYSRAALRRKGPACPRIAA